MKKSRYTEEQIIGMWKRHEAGVKAADLYREHGIQTRNKRGELSTAVLEIRCRRMVVHPPIG